MYHTVSITTTNEPGELSRIVGLFSGRGVNIESLSGASALNKDRRRLTIVASGDDKAIAQIVRSCRRLMLVSRVQQLSQQAHIERELALFEVNVDGQDATSRLIDLAASYGATVVHASRNCMLLQIVAEQNKVDAFVDVLRSSGLEDVVRSGAVAIASSGSAERKRSDSKMATNLTPDSSY